MSAWIVAKPHIDLLVAALVSGTRDGKVPALMPDTNRDELGQLLHDENVKSVSYRYSEPARDRNLPGPCVCYYLQPYTWSDPGYRLTYAELNLAMSCYRYQSCEHPEFEKSEAWRICQLIDDRYPKALSKQYGCMEAIVRSTPEGQAAPWGWDEREVEARRGQMLEAFLST